MSEHRRSVRRRLRALATALFATATLGAAGVLAGIAIAKTFVLATARHAPVTAITGQTVHEPIVVTRHGFAVYTLSGDSQRHPECTSTNGCFAFWPPVTVRSTHVAKPAGVRGKLSTWRRDGFIQLVLAGHPLYRFALDSRRRAATGEGIRTFGGTWHVVRPASS